MRRETRINLILLLGLVALSVPGAARMFWKKYNDPREMYQSDHRRPVVPYMMPNAGVTPRDGPAVVEAWAAGYAAGEPLSPPVMSKALTFQVLSRDEGRARVMAWDPTLSRRLVLGGQTELPLPPAVVDALRDGGYVRPPASVAVATVPVADGVIELGEDVAELREQERVVGGGEMADVGLESP